jgi:hypothetical protein
MTEISPEPISFFEQVVYVFCLFLAMGVMIVSLLLLCKTRKEDRLTDEQIRKLKR